MATVFVLILNSFLTWKNVMKKEKNGTKIVFLDFHSNISFSVVGNEYSNSAEQPGKTTRPLS